MNIFSFFSSLLPSFERSQISQDVDDLSSEVHDTVLPILKKANALLGKGPYRSKQLTDASGVLHMLLRQYANLGYFDALLHLFNNLPANLSYMAGLIEGQFAKDVTKETLTYRKMAILRYLEIVRFAVHYTTKSTSRFLAAETAMTLNKPDQVDALLAPAEVAWLEQNRSAYQEALKLLAVDVHQLTLAVDQIPDITVVPENAAMIKHTVGQEKLDPLKLNLISAGKNPIYHIRMRMAEYQTRRYKAKIETKRELELHLIALKEAQAGIDNPKLAEQIEYSTGRLQKLTRELAEEAADFV